MVKEQGFTLIEFVAALSISSVLALITMDIINFPIQSYLQINERALMLDSAQEIEDQLRRDLQQMGVSSSKVTADGKQLTIKRLVSSHQSTGWLEYQQRVQETYSTDNIIKNQTQIKKKRHAASTIIYLCDRDELSTKVMRLTRYVQPVSLKAKSGKVIRQHFSTALVSCKFMAHQRVGTSNALIAMRFKIKGQHQPSVPFFYQLATALY